MEIKIKKLHKDAIIPIKSTSGAAGYDLYTCEDTTVPANGRVIAKTGIAIELPHGYSATVRPRSGFSAKGIEGYCHIGGEAFRFNADVMIGLIDAR